MTGLHKETELHEDVLVSLRRIIRATDLHSRTLGKAAGLTTPQLVVLRCVAGLAAPTVTEIARSVSLSQATVTSILNRLEARSLLRRERSREDKRRVHLRMTPRGERLLADAPLPIQERFLERFRALETWEQHQLVSSLARIASMMDAEDLDAAPLLASGEEMA